MTQHSIIPPSSAHIWGASEGCTGWVMMSQQYPETEDSPEAMKGTATHEIGARLIEEGTRGVPAWSDSFIGEKAANGIIFTDKMFEAAKLYADDVIEVMRDRAIFGGPNIGIEYHVKAPQIHELSEGTLDCFIWDSKAGDLFLWDAKFGHKLIDVFEHWQLINYAAGILEELGINGLQDQHINIHFRIAQPLAFHRDGPIREWIVKASAIRGHINTLHSNAGIALSMEATTHSGDHCYRCSARHACESALSAGIQLYEVSNQPTPVELSPAALGVQLTIIKRAVKQLEYLESGFDEQVKNLVRSGVNVPGWMVEAGVGREAWNKPTPEIIALGDALGHDLRKPDNLITPNQARKMGVDDAIIAAYSEKSSTGLKLVPDNGNKARRIFESQ